MYSIRQIVALIDEAEFVFQLSYLEDEVGPAVDRQAKVNRYPHFGDTTAQVFNGPEEWSEWKKTEIRGHLAARREAIKQQGGEANHG